MNYYKVRFECSPCTEDITDLLAAFLADLGFESFEPDPSGLTAYIQADEYSEESVREVISDFPMETCISFETEFVESKNWNEEWEKHYFQPIVISGECVVHSSFHKDVPKARYDILIDPKMAFGTGHHATTSQMMRYILDIDDIEGKSVIDMGTGTGILAILCKMRGAGSATGIEIDPGAFENAVENAALNSQTVNFICGDASALEKCDPADIFLANINRNVITSDIDRYAAKIKSGGVLLLSGFYTNDIPVVMAAAEPLGFTLDKTSEEGDHWAALRLIKK
ncbi:MAG: 50S ribosomal protein L11 methyltransferase [Muribaculaceae bacterium]|nr:50S ribosomal protein L11 methyltransferase [Muribaculaceae bacterium]MDE7096502.1 50S ribosomal protein L11 methyltransferase [Muribaculaceae bacterium]